MTPKQRIEFQRLEWMESRIPRLDALSIFVPKGQENDPLIVQMRDRIGFSRWEPTPTGHMVMFPYEGGHYDADRFEIKPGAWDHEHCKGCQMKIPANSLCWVTKSGHFIALCQPCHGLLTD